MSQAESSAAGGPGGQPYVTIRRQEEGRRSEPGDGLQSLDRANCLLSTQASRTAVMGAAIGQ